MAKTTKAVAKKESGEVAAFMDDEFLEDYSGFENVDQKDYNRPFLSILQSNSDVVQDEDKDAKAGQFYHTATEEVFDSPIRVVIVGYEKGWTEWEPNGGPFVARHDRIPEEAILKPDGFRYNMPREDGDVNDLKETHYFYVVMPDRPELGLMAMSLKSTNIKYVKAWLTRARNLKIQVKGKSKPCPLYLKIWEIGTAQNKNAQDKKYYCIGKEKRPLVSVVGDVTQELWEGGIKAAVELFRELDTKKEFKESAATAEPEGEHEDW